MSSKAKGYAFPLRNSEELLKFLETELPDLGFVREDIQRPKARGLQSFYVKMLDLLVGLNQDRLFQTQFTASTPQEYPQYHEESNKLANLTVAMRKLMCIAGFEDFNLGDVIDPERERTLVIMSALQNFYYFSKAREDEFQTIVQQKNAVIEQKRHLKEANEALQRQINEIRAKRAQQKPELDKWKIMVSEISSEIDEKQKECAETKKAIAETKAALEELSQKKSKLEDALSSARRDGDALSQQIVQSPERMKMERERMEKRLLDLEDVKRNLQEQRSGMFRRHNTYSSIVKMLGDMFESLQSVQLDINKKEEAEKKLAGLEKVLKEKKENLTEVQNRRQQLKSLVDSKQEKQSRLNFQHKNALDSLREALAQEKRNAEVLSQQERDVQVLEKERRSVLDKSEKSKVEHEETLEMLAGLYEKLLHQVESYNNNLQENWGVLKESQDEMAIKTYKAK